MTYMMLNVHFRTLKKLNLGSSYTVKSWADVPFMRIRYGSETKYIIPGSSIKGVLRTTLIKLSGLLGYGDVNPSVRPEELSQADDTVVSLFGGPHVRDSKIFVEPAYVDIDTIRLAHVSIDDKSMTAREMALFTVEYLPFGTEFQTRIHCYNLSVEEARALFISLYALRYEAIGKSGLVEARIDLENSIIPEEYMGDELIREVLEAIRI